MNDQENNTSILIIAHAQVWMFALALAGFLALLFVLVIGNIKLDPSTEKLVYSMLQVLGSVLTFMVGYFYGKQRASSGTVDDIVNPPKVTVPTAPIASAPTIPASTAVPSPSPVFNAPTNGT